MGFFRAMGRIMAGKPVYDPSDNQQYNVPNPGEDWPAAGQPGSETPGAPPATAPAGPKSIPVVRIRRIENQLNGSKLTVYADLHNEAAEPIFLDRVFFVGQKRELDSQLRPGEARQYVLYAGPVFASQPVGYAEVQYRKVSDGDYFANYHQVRSRQTPHGWEITDLLLQGPVKDI